MNVGQQIAFFQKLQNEGISNQQLSNCSAVLDKHIYSVNQKNPPEFF